MSGSFLLNDTFRKALFLLAAACCLTPFIEPPVALLLGLILSQTIGHPFAKVNSKVTKILLQVSVVGLGFGMNIFEAAKAGKEGLAFTIISISATFAAGIFAGRLLNVHKKTSLLISAGTAICGGSAIAAVSPIIEAEENEMSVSLGTVFILNSVALFIFPLIGVYLQLSQTQFGMWAAIAIHDTSSVVGAAQKYGAEALQIATVVKLERALWIIPVAFVTALVSHKNKNKVQIPYFILYFVVAMLLNTFIPQLHDMGTIIVMIAKKGLTLTLFLIGAGLTRSALKSVGIRPFLLGVLLWAIISVSSLAVVMHTIN
jgi:uncharacterized integral membrane protein (TIGR00698 family)